MLCNDPVLLFVFLPVVWLYVGVCISYEVIPTL